MHSQLKHAEAQLKPETRERGTRESTRLAKNWLHAFHAREKTSSADDNHNNQHLGVLDFMGFPVVSLIYTDWA